MSSDYLNRWSIEIEDSQENMINYANVINEIIHIIAEQQSVWLIDYKKETNIFIEVFLNSLVKFHINRLNLNNKNIYASCWAESSQYCFSYVHTHIDHCDIEKRLYSTETRRPFLTCITYFDDSDIPLIATNITEEMYKIKEYTNNNNHLYIEFPRLLKHIVFPAGKYFHGESYLNKQYEEKNRKKIVIALWTEENKPLYLPTLATDMLLYQHCYRIKDINSMLNIACKIENKSPITFKPINSNIKRINITNTDTINHRFFENFIEKKKKYSAECLNRYIEEYKADYSSFILDFSKIILSDANAPSNTSLHGLDVWNTNNNIDIINNIFNDTNYVNKEILFDLSAITFTPLEKYVYDLVYFHFKRIGVHYDEKQKTYNKNVWVSYYVNSNTNYNVNTTPKPFLTLYTNYTTINDNDNISVFTNLTSMEPKKLEICNSNLFVTKNNSNLHYSFNNKYINMCSKNTLIINIWTIKPTHLSYNDIKPNNNSIKYKTTNIIDITPHILNKEPILVNEDTILNMINDVFIVNKNNSLNSYLLDDKYAIIKINEIEYNISSLLQTQLVFDVDNTI